jgi:hypothetical protein
MATMMMSPSALDAAEDGNNDEVVVSAGGCFIKVVPIQMH